MGRDDLKRFSDSQLQGLSSEKQFEAWATGLGLLPMKIEPDEGFDHVCQVIGSRVSSRSYAMTGKMIVVCVRSVSTGKDYISQNRSDVENVNSTNLPAIIEFFQNNKATQEYKFLFRHVDE